MISPGVKPTSTNTSGAAPTSPPTAVNISGSKAEFVNALLPAAIEESKRTGVDPRIIVAQAAQETGWGKNAPGNNFFGIKSHGKGGGQSLNTHEYVDGKRVNVKDSFRTFGSPDDTKVWIGDERVRIHLFVGTLGYSRRMHARASLRERQADWFEGMEGAFLRFGGVPAEVLIDNAKALVEHHD